MSAPAKDGIYYGIPEDEYHAWDAVGGSSLAKLADSVALYRRPYDGGSDAMSLGTVTHLAILEPDRFSRLVPTLDAADYPDRIVTVAQLQAALDAAGVEYKKSAKKGDLEDALLAHDETARVWSAMRKAHSAYLASTGRTEISSHHHRLAVAMRKAVAAYIDAAQEDTSHPWLFNEPFDQRTGRAEVSLIWTDPDTRVRCKARLDWLHTGIVDLKTTREPRPAKFRWSIRDFGYAEQAAHYIDGYAQLTGETLDYHICAVGSDAPHHVAVYSLSAETLDHARARNRRALRRLAEHRVNGGYDGLDTDIIEI